MKRFIPIMLLLCLLLSQSACNVRTPEPSTVPTIGFDIHEVTFTKTPVKLLEATNAIGASFGLNKDLQITQWNGVTYAFEPSISLDDRQECITATDAILKEIGCNQSIQLHIYAKETYDCSFIEGNSVFTHLQDWYSPEYISVLLYGLFGEYCSYGMIYGYANYLARELYGLPLDICKDGWEYDGSLDALDLNILCFRSEFTSDKDIESVRKIANTFVSGYIQTHGTAQFHKLLENSGDIQTIHLFTGALADFYAANNLHYTPTQLLYRLGGKGYDYIVKCEYATMYIEKDWYDANKDLCPYTYDGFLHQNYADTRQFFTINIAQMEQYQRLFALDPYDHNLKIFFTNHSSNTSYYHYGLHAVALWNTASFMHEYIHALTWKGIIRENWAGEGLARYYGHRYDYYGNAFSSADYNSLPNESKWRWVHEFKANLGRDIDTSIDFEELQHLHTYAFNYDDPNDAKGYASGASFIGYLISRFGEEKVIEILCVTHDFGEYTYEALVADWQTYIRETYSGYSKVKSDS